MLISGTYIAGMSFNTASLEDALATLGEVLEARDLRFDVVVVGGGSLLLLGRLKRPTKDLDVLALVGATELESAEPLPKELRTAVKDVAATLELADDWLNPGPTSLLDFGLPAGFRDRLTTKTFGGLTVRIAGLVDQICFKFYATVDQGPRSKHAQDLRLLAPSREEMIAAARWARTHDPSDGFRVLCVQALAAFGVEDGDAVL
jgi:hypothetical protein